MTLTFAHNPARQIVSRSVPASASFYAYSPGNGDTTYGVDGLNRLTTAGPASLGYDGRGNLTSVGSVTYDYDKANRLIATGEGASLTYDPIDRLYRTARSGFQTTKFLYDGPNLIAECDDAGTAILRRYVHGPGVDEPLVWYEGPTVNDKRWHQADNQGSILAMSQGLGGTPGTYRYDAYGQLYVDPGQISRFQYTGQTAVPEAGLLNYKARMYSPALGRFMQTDPVGYGAGLNWYAYVGGDPVNNIDPTGLERVCAAATGSHIPACVGVDGDGDGSVADHDLTRRQVSTLSQDFAGFIASHDGANLSRDGKEVYLDDNGSGVGAGVDRTEEGAMVRATSQFVGRAMAEEGGRIASQWARVDSLMRRPLNGGAHATRDDNNIIQFRSAATPFYSSPSNLARWMLHETRHVGAWIWPFSKVQNLFGAHQRLDERARSTLLRRGLGGGGCIAGGRFPSC